MSFYLPGIHTTCTRLKLRFSLPYILCLRTCQKTTLFFVYLIYCNYLFFSLLGLKFLVRLCTDLGLKDAQEYANKLKKAEKAAKMREEVCLQFVI